MSTLLNIFKIKKILKGQLKSVDLYPGAIPIQAYLTMPLSGHLAKIIKAEFLRTACVTTSPVKREGLGEVRYVQYNNFC